ncbi:hypothetical protein SELMODRAFT_118113 [Selaginella moellendorffii]|uniref:Carboxypeptidase Taq n=1 Tax=Selaginella moellendorffii TaxID=88036 RepID=D8SJ14_SELML|nr:hypothetical protein SELMODRAFT_118113 [Selaginella moellendorffii]
MCTKSSLMEQLRQQLGEIEAIGSVMALLQWDQQVTLPAGAHQARKRQVEALASLLYKMQNSEELGSCLERAREIDPSTLSAMERATIREAYREYSRVIKTRESLYRRISGLEVTAQATWEQARRENRFDLMAPVISEWISIRKEEAAVVSPGMDPYDYVLDEHERGSSVQKMDRMFERIKQPLIGLLAKIKQPDYDTPGVAFPMEPQRELARKIIQDMGFNGRLDDSVHPMTVPVSPPSDVRITSKFIENNPRFGILAAIHETGHALYEQGRVEEPGLIALRPLSTGMHESQSLFWERMVGLSREFWDHYWPGSGLAKHGVITGDGFYRYLTRVKPSLVRVEADEITYPLHILIRYEIEKGLFDGSLSVTEIPSVWNAKMEEYLGVTVSNDAQGCLQASLDIHWSLGIFGYFPTYVLGAIYACQLFDAADRDLGGLVRQNIAQGKFAPLREWLRDKVHSIGRLYETAEELLQVVTGKGMDPDGFVRHLTLKYSEINLSTRD